MSEEILPFLIIPLIFLIIFPLFWAAVVWFVGFVSGWRVLAQAYRGRPFPQNACWNWQSMALRYSSRYRSSLTFCADIEGVYIQPMWLFRAGHAPLFIPWEEIEGKVERYMLIEMVTLRFQRTPKHPARISMQLATQLMQASSGRWQVLLG